MRTNLEAPASMQRLEEEDEGPAPSLSKTDSLLDLKTFFNQQSLPPTKENPQSPAGFLLRIKQLEQQN